jgi:FkbM family methyltransferase
MRVVSNLLPQEVRHRLRHGFDAIYSKSFPDKETIGVTSQWTIRTHDMHPGAIVYSGGVGGDISFELDLIRRFGVKIQIFDPSPVAQRTVDLADSSNLQFNCVGLAASESASFSVGGVHEGKIWLKKGGDKKGADETVSCTTLKAEMAKNGHQHIDLLKIDIEGFEYEILETCVDAQIPIKQICLEFHDFFPEIPKEKTRNAIRSLKSCGYQLIHRCRHDHTFYRVADHTN